MTFNPSQNEIETIIATIHSEHGYDFSRYSQASLYRRFCHVAEKLHINDSHELIDLIKHSKQGFAEFLAGLSVTVTEMFRDPTFYKAFRQHVAPTLKTYATINIWHAGCATGEEVYSLAILLEEEGLLDRAKIYATDINTTALDIASAGVYPMDKLALYTKNYHDAGGVEPFSNYYTGKYDHVMIHKHIKQHIIFSHHNLTCDSIFNEMQVILCRNVLIYFNRELQNDVLALLSNSLSSLGFLCLGLKESLLSSPLNDDYRIIAPDKNIYRKMTDATYPLLRRSHDEL